MSSDLDQGGSLREWTRVYLGPTIGWVLQQILTPASSTVTTGGTTTIGPGTSVVLVNFNGSVTIQLPSSMNAAVPGIPGVTIPPYLNPPPITISDAGGHAGTFPITILPFGTEKVLGLNSIQITVNWGAFSLDPIPTGGWSQS
jgi:hypothetical protein